MTYQDSNRIPADRELLARIFSCIKISDTYSYNNSPCWEWQRKPNPEGYGKLKVNKRPWPIHRLMYGIFVHIIPKGLVSDHLCRNRICCNPAHIEPVTDRVNVLRGEGEAVKNLAKTHCKHGHPLEGHNLLITIDKKGRIGRQCRICCYRLQNEFHSRLNDLPFDHPKQVQYRNMPSRRRRYGPVL